MRDTLIYNISFFRTRISNEWPRRKSICRIPPYPTSSVQFSSVNHPRLFICLFLQKQTNKQPHVTAGASVQPASGRNPGQLLPFRDNSVCNTVTQRFEMNCSNCYVQNISRRLRYFWPSHTSSEQTSSKQWKLMLFRTVLGQCENLVKHKVSELSCSRFIIIRLALLGIIFPLVLIRPGTSRIDMFDSKISKSITLTQTSFLASALDTAKYLIKPIEN